MSQSGFMNGTPTTGRYLEQFCIKDFRLLNWNMYFKHVEEFRFKAHARCNNIRKLDIV